MKKALISILLAIGFVVPVSAFADALVQVYPTVTNAHGGTLFGPTLSTTIIYGSGQTQDQTGVPTYDLGSGPVTYTVTADSFSGYSAALDQGCSGTVQEGQTIVCNVSWSDGAPVVSTHAPQPAPAAPASSIPSTTGTTIVIPDASQASSTSDEQSQIAALQAEIVHLLQQLVTLLQARIAAQTI
jgi:hypothetical protein